MLTAFPAHSSDFSVDGISYEIISDEFGTVAVTDIDLQGEECIIPETVNNRGHSYKVVAIGELEYHYSAFAGTLIMPNSIVDIAKGAFKHSIIKRVVFSNQIKVISEESFYDCRSLQSVVLPVELKAIGISAFSGCESLQSVDFPDDLRYIGASAFSKCISLQGVDLPDGLRYIGSDAFHRCASLQSVDLPDGLRYIGSNTFNGCTLLQNVDLPDGLLYIEREAFYGCTSLQSVDLPDGLRYMGSGAFSGCASLQSVALPDGLRHIGSSAFSGCESLQNVDLPDGLWYMGVSAFSGCASLRSVDLSDGLVCINGGCFDGCTSLRSATLSTGLVGDHPLSHAIFSGCASLQSVKFRANSRNSGVNSKKRSLNRIGDYMFLGCKSIESIEIPEGILEIGDYVFEDCNQLSEVSLPDGLVSIGSMSFNETKIKKVVFPKSMLYIGYGSFTNFDMVSYISEVVSLNPEPPYCSGLNSDICTHAVLSVPAGCKQKYLSHSSNWRLFSTINEIGQPGAVENVKAADGIKVNVQDGAIHIDGIEVECPVYVYDLSGRLVEYGISSENLHVDSSGVYLVRVMGETYKVFVGK